MKNAENGGKTMWRRYNIQVAKWLEDDVVEKHPAVVSFEF